MKQKGLAPILIVLFIALAVGGYLLYQKQQQTIQATPTPTSTPESTNSAETANWKTYTNIKYGFSVSYPTDDKKEYGVLKLLFENNETKQYVGKEELIRLFSFTIGYPASDAAIIFRLWENNNQLSVQKWWDKNHETFYTQTLDLKWEPKSTSAKNVGNQQTLAVLIEGTNGLQMQTYYFANNKYVMEVLSIINEKLSEKILSTFKFTQ